MNLLTCHYEAWEPVCLSVCLFIYLSIYLSVCMSVCLSVCLSVYLFVYLSNVASILGTITIIIEFSSVLYLAREFFTKCFPNPSLLDVPRVG